MKSALWRLYASDCGLKRYGSKGPIVTAIPRRTCRPISISGGTTTTWLCGCRRTEKAFLAEVRQELEEQLRLFNEDLPKNRAVRILEKGNGWISLSPLTKQA